MSARDQQPTLSIMSWAKVINKDGCASRMMFKNEKGGFPNEKGT